MTAPQLLYHKWLKEMIERLPEKEHKKRIQSFVKLLVGLFYGRGIHLQQIAQGLAGSAQQTSKVRGLLRVVDNSKIRVRRWYEPISRDFLAAAAQSGRPLRLLMDGSKVGNGHQLLMVALAYRRRAIPLVWTWRKGTRGHSPTHVQIALLAAARRLIPDGCEVIVCGDSEFGTVGLMQRLEQWNWCYVLRQKGRNLWRTTAAGEWQRCDSVLSASGRRVWQPAVQLTKAHAHLTNLYALWLPSYDQPWLLASNLDDPYYIRLHYSRRAWIENFFGDCKRQGFDLEATRLQHFSRLNRLMLAVSILVVWLLAFGSYVVKRGWRYLVDRTDRRDLSLFRIGLEMILRLLNNGDPLSLRLLPYF